MGIAIFSGSFDPIHNGHLAIAHEVLAQGAADEVWFLVSPQNPLKNNSALWPKEDRLEMVKLALENEPKMRASDFEFKLPQPSYTIKTLDGLKAIHPQQQFLLLIGGDNLAIFHKWFEYQRIVNEYGLIVYQRPDFPIPEDPIFSNITIVTAPLIGLSATEIRGRLAKGEQIGGLVPEKVARFLDQKLANSINCPSNRQQLGYF